MKREGGERRKRKQARNFPPQGIARRKEEEEVSSKKKREKENSCRGEKGIVAKRDKKRERGVSRKRLGWWRGGGALC